MTRRGWAAEGAPCPWAVGAQERSGEVALGEPGVRGSPHSRSLFSGRWHAGSRTWPGSRLTPRWAFTGSVRSGRIHTESRSPASHAHAQPPAPADPPHKLCDLLKNTPQRRGTAPNPFRPSCSAGNTQPSPAPPPTVQLLLNQSCDVGQQASALSCPHPPGNLLNLGQRFPEHIETETKEM